MARPSGEFRGARSCETRSLQLRRVWWTEAICGAAPSGSSAASLSRWHAQPALRRQICTARFRAGCGLRVARLLAPRVRAVTFRTIIDRESRSAGAAGKAASRRSSRGGYSHRIEEPENQDEYIPRQRLQADLPSSVRWCWRRRHRWRRREEHLACATRKISINCLCRVVHRGNQSRWPCCAASGGC